MLNLNHVPANMAPVTKHDVNYLPKGTCMLYVGGAGDLVVQGENAVGATIVALAGSYHFGRFKRVMNASTATAIVAFHGPAL